MITFMCVLQIISSAVLVGYNWKTYKKACREQKAVENRLGEIYSRLTELGEK